MKWILLPAFDGTGKMFGEFAQSLGESFATIPIAYPVSGPQDYDSLADDVLARLPRNEDFVILGESFAGPIVYRIATHGLPNCKAAVFVATYLTNPRPLFLTVMNMFPARLIALFITRPWIVRLLSLSGSAASRVAHAIADNFASVAPAIIKQRLQTINSANEKPLKDILLPCLYLQAGSDRLVLPKKLSDFRARCSMLTTVTAPGGHFVLQENPAGSAAVVQQFCREHGLN